LNTSKAPLAGLEVAERVTLPPSGAGRRDLPRTVRFGRRAARRCAAAQRPPPAGARQQCIRSPRLRRGYTGCKLKERGSNGLGQLLLPGWIRGTIMHVGAHAHSHQHAASQCPQVRNPDRPQVSVGTLLIHLCRRQPQEARTIPHPEGAMSFKTRLQPKNDIVLAEHKSVRIFGP